MHPYTSETQRLLSELFDCGGLKLLNVLVMLLRTAAGCFPPPRMYLIRAFRHITPLISLQTHTYVHTRCHARAHGGCPVICHFGGIIQKQTPKLKINYIK